MEEEEEEVQKNCVLYFHADSQFASANQSLRKTKKTESIYLPPHSPIPHPAPVQPWSFLIRIGEGVFSSYKNY